MLILGSSQKTLKGGFLTLLFQLVLVVLNMLSNIGRQPTSPTPPSRYYRGRRY